MTRSVYDAITELNRFTVGFEDFARTLSGFNAQSFGVVNYPPFNIRKLTDTLYAIELAVAGFEEKDLDITVQNCLLTVASKKQDADGDYLYQGISHRSFKRAFQLAEHVEIIDAELHAGILTIHLTKQLPPEKLARTIDINTGAKAAKAQLLTE